jgi:cytochrome c peroxidase
MKSTYLNPTVIAVLTMVVAVSIIFGALRNMAVTEKVDLSVKAAEGAELFNDKGCSQCHFTGSTETRIGPGLLGLFDRGTLPASGRPVSEENVRGQLLDPFRSMPSYSDRLTREEQDQIISFLKTL